MAKVAKNNTASCSAPAQLTMDLAAPGMTLVHRAGLGGLACSLKAIQNRAVAGQVKPDELPGGPWSEGNPPWSVEDQTITLNFGQPEGAAEYLKRLFQLSFRLDDDLIDLPGQYFQRPNPEVRAELQAGLLLTFLQHGKTRKLAKPPPMTYSYDPDGSGGAPATVEYRVCSWYKHQDGWQDVIDTGSGCLLADPVEVIGPLHPGAAVRHNAFPGQTKLEETPERLIPLYFALVGCLTLPVNRGVGVLLVPEVSNLRVFSRMRPLMTPTASIQCRIASAGDAALQAQVRLRSKREVNLRDLPGCYAMTFRPTAWASQQKSRVATLHVPPGDEQKLIFFEEALLHLAPRPITITENETQGRGKTKTVIPHTRRFWADSVIRPLVADNLAQDRCWYTDFARLMTAVDVNGHPLRKRVQFERKGLHAMIQTLSRDDEITIVRAVHAAIRFCLKKIRVETDGPGKGPASHATINRWNRFNERLRLDLTGAKTLAQCRGALCTLFGKAGRNRPLQQDGWIKLLPLFREEKWREARDLGLIALASYSTTKVGQPPPTDGSVAGK
jgi:CRISPR-associated protein Cas8a1/Csx13